MIPKVTKGGRSFKGAFKYYMHDPNAETRDRIAWTHTRNMMTENPDKAWKVMAYTAKSQDRLKEASGQKMTGRKAEKPVLAYSLSWHPDEDPGRDHMLEVAMKSLKELGLKDHEAIIIAHRDTPHDHVHVVANRIHPITGIVASDSNSYRKLSDFSREYQQEHGIELCPQREENYKKREEGKSSQYNNPNIQDAWDASKNGASFMAELEKRGFQLAQGRKRLVVVDPYGKTLNPVRHIDDVKTKEFNSRMQDIDADILPDATELAKQVVAQRKKLKEETKDRQKPSLKEDFERAASIPEEAEAKTDRTSQSGDQRTNTKEDIQAAETAAVLNRLQDRHIKERDDVSSHYHRRIEHQRNYLENFYKMNEQRDDIVLLQEKCSNPTLWRRIFGLARHDRQELQNLKSSYGDAKMRLDERIISLDNEYTRSLEKLKLSQEKEWDRACDLTIESKQDKRRKELKEQYSSRQRTDKLRGPNGP